MCKPLLCTAGVGWALNTASCAGPCHCVWPYNVQAAAALDISSSVFLAIKYQSPATHTHRPLPFQSQSQVWDWKGRLAVLCRPQKEGEKKKKQLFFSAEPSSQRQTMGGNRNRRSPGQPRRAKLLEGTLVTEQKKVGCVKGFGQSFRETRGSCKLEKERENHLSKWS